MLNERTHATSSAPDYAARVNRAIDHIVGNLTQPLGLKELSEVAGFSPFHFHRIFKGVVGEALNPFVTRQRLERALHQMAHAPRRSLTDVALACGFSSSSAFSRAFKKHYRIAPSAFDLAAFRDRRRKDIEEALVSAVGSSRITAAPDQQNPDGFKVKLRDLPARTVAYIRVFDPYREGAVRAACERLLAWAMARGLADGQWLGYMWDEPEIVALADCRYDTALVVEHVEADVEVGRFRFPPMRVAEVFIRGDLALEARAIDWLYETWLPSSGYVPDDQPTFEAWSGRPFAHGTEHFELACQLPVKRA